MARAAYLATEIITWDVIVPSSLASLATGLISSLGSGWGLVRHYWILTKLVLTVLATVLLVVYTRPIGVVADAAAGSLSADLRPLRIQLVADAAAAALVLLVAAVLAVYQPRGMTRYGQHKQYQQRSALVSS